MNVIRFPLPSLNDIPGALRLLADQIDSGNYGIVHGLAWVMNSESAGIDVGLLGGAAEVAPVTHYLLCLGQRKLETLE